DLDDEADQAHQDGHTDKDFSENAHGGTLAGGDQFQNTATRMFTTVSPSTEPLSPLDTSSPLRTASTASTATASATISFTPIFAIEGPPSSQRPLISAMPTMMMPAAAAPMAPCETPL